MRIAIPDYMKPDEKDPGEVLLGARLYREALPFLQARYQRDPKNPRFRVALGLCLFYHDEFEGAESLLRTVTVSDPDKAMSWHALGNVVEGLGRFDEALECYQKAAAILPDQPAINYGVASNLMRAGRFDEAWDYWENGRMTLSVDTAPIWEGEDLNGKKLLVIREGGYGDVIWMMRYFKLIKEMGAHITLYAYSGMRGLLHGHPWIDLYCDASNVIETSEFDYQISLLSIPAVLRVCPLGMDKPYLVSRHLAPRNGHNRVGLCWTAGEHGGVVRKIRNIPVEEVEPLRDIPVEWVNLQIDTAPPEWMADNREEIRGWHKTCDMMASLDAVVSSDTAVLHLAGAMGVPTVGLLPCNFEWKWRFDQEWYPSLRTVKSTSPISFAPAVERAIPVIKEMVGC